MTINDQIRQRVLEALDELKKSKDLSYKELMESLNDVPQVHTQLKSGRRYPTLEHIVLLNQVHKYSFNWLLLGVPPRRLVKSKTPIERVNEMELDLKDLKKHLVKR